MNRMAAAQISLWIGALVVLAQPALAIPQKTEIRVRLERQLPTVEVSGFSLQITRSGGIVTVAAPPGASLAQDILRAKVARNSKGIWTVKWNGVKTPEKIHSEKLWVRGQLVRVGLKPVPYDFEIAPNAKQGLDVVARLDLDTYLAGVLPSEMPMAWPIEALKAQAVAARSFVLRMAYERRDKSFDVESTIHDQVYKFLDHADNHPEWKDKLNRAIVETKGEVLLDDRKRLLKAFYSADCGCQSEDPRFVWGEHSSFTSVVDPSCGDRKPSLWNLSLNRSEVRSKLLAALNLPETSNLRALHIGSRTPSGRVAELIAGVEVAQGKMQKFAVKAQEFRKLIGFQRVLSTDFDLRWLGEKLEISGRGRGHGVGLCQRGAMGLASNGMNYRDILKLYYPRASLASKKQI